MRKKTNITVTSNQMSELEEFIKKCSDAVGNMYAIGAYGTSIDAFDEGLRTIHALFPASVADNLEKYVIDNVKGYLEQRTNLTTQASNNLLNGGPVSVIPGAPVLPPMHIIWAGQDLEMLSDGTLEVHLIPDTNKAGIIIDTNVSAVIESRFDDMDVVALDVTLNPHGIDIQLEYDAENVEEIAQEMQVYETGVNNETDSEAPTEEDTLEPEEKRRKGFFHRNK